MPDECYICSKSIAMGNVLLFVSGSELVLVLLLALLFFGANSIPEIARTLGKGMREFKKATSDIQREFEDHTSGLKKDVNDFTNSVNSESNKLSRKIEEELEDKK